MTTRNDEDVTVPRREPQATLRVCTSCGAAVADARLHDAWHRRVERRASEALMVHDELEDLRDRVLDRIASRPISVAHASMDR
ncbi:hypothetical protein GCM10011519_24720 [Marmoricola endophyticus]|uniref:Uncharacterized protein n=1 Tax=Marmoricola endophyticus TaxID=2040280 RepID=A0A917BMQ4_9ACTN|nr:hypothetical protein [Marmoricola endophyticus]GGF49810.1 hypothetical protein GCM10011519_24720 [Marmoricola endophyticus]